MNELITISGVRGFIGKNGTAYLNLEDVARGLGFTQIAASGNESIRWERVNRYLTDFGLIPTSGDDKDAIPAYIPENIFYRLAMKAKNAVAEKFQAKVADEILPAIRKTGSYTSKFAIPQTLSEALQLAADQAKQIEIDKPKVLFAESVQVTTDTILIRELAKLISQSGVKVGEKRLFKWLRGKGYLIKKIGADYNKPTQKAMEMGLFKITEHAITHSNGVQTHTTARVTGKGQLYFINKFLSDSINAGDNNATKALYGKRSV
ncbi:phage antirepressor [Pectinatus frisingensis]|uniref:phage antirepressor n=1 Tax=Pectinatus frisingensis TaxID=865 RepID=UPI001E4B3406|nr:phage antirepressor KilAC domain-containing protein [Pectinatus frisingensis]